MSRKDELKTELAVRREELRILFNTIADLKHELLAEERSDVFNYGLLNNFEYDLNPTGEALYPIGDYASFAVFDEILPDHSCMVELSDKVRFYKEDMQYMIVADTFDDLVDFARTFSLVIQTTTLKKEIDSLVKKASELAKIYQVVEGLNDEL